MGQSWTLPLADTSRTRGDEDLQSERRKAVRVAVEGRRRGRTSLGEMDSMVAAGACWEPED